MHRFLKSKINRRIIASISKIALVSLGLLAFTSLTGTYAYFADTETAKVNVSAGIWIPTLEMSVEPASPDGENGWYKTSPCITLEAYGITVGSSEIYYEFSDDGDPINGGTKYTGGCVYASDGDPTHFQAQAVNTLNSNWKSNIVSDTFKVDTTPPSQPAGLTIYKGHNPATKVEVGCDGITDTTKITINWAANSESDIEYYWFGTKFNKYHRKVDSSKTEYLVNMTPGHNPYHYTVIAVDKSGNESPISKSCGDLTLNQVQPGDVVINEVYYDIDTATKGSDPSNEWVELYNNADQDISLKDWKIVDAALNEGTIDTDISIPAKGFAVLSGNSSTFDNWTLPSGAVVINTSGWPALNNTGDSLALKNPSGTEIDYVAWEGENGWSITANDGESIARRTKGVDTDSESDWEVLTSPNPGTNPHSFLNNGSQNSSEEVEAEEHEEQNSKDNQEENQNEENNEQNKNEDNDNEKKENKKGENLEEPKEKEAPSEEESKKEENSEGDSEGDNKEEQ